MSTAGSELLGKVAEMRRQFDESFARPRPHHLPAGESMLAIVVRGEPFAVRLAETAGLAALEGKILPVPSEAKELLGLIGHRGTVVPVFSLAALLGYSSGSLYRGGQPHASLHTANRAGRSPIAHHHSS